MRYVAFLRGVNVGGHAPVRSADLVRSFERVVAFRASGNVLFSTASGIPDSLGVTLANVVRKIVGGPVDVFVRSLHRLDELVDLDPFRGPHPPLSRPFVTFLSQPPGRSLEMPRRSPAGDVEAVRVSESDVFSWGRRIGRALGFPNPYIEKWVDSRATTRSWSTILSLLALDR